MSAAERSNSLLHLAGSALALFILALGPAAEAQRGGGTAVTPVSEAMLAEQGFDPEESAGLFVGVSEFADTQFAAIPYAVDDAVDLAHLFSMELRMIAPERVHLALAGEPKKEESRDRLDLLIEEGAVRTLAGRQQVLSLLIDQRKQVGSKGVLVVAVATHGFEDADSQHLVTTDSRFELRKDTSIATDTVFNEVSEARSLRRIVLLDACRERLSSARGMGAEGESAMGEGLASALAAAEGQVILAGTTKNGYSYDDPRRSNGVFTGAVLDGLRGAAPSDERSLITARNLALYVNEQVRDWVQRERPNDDKSRGISSIFEGDAADMPLAMSGADLAKAWRQRRDAAGKLVTGAALESDELTVEAVRYLQGKLQVEHPGPDEEDLVRWIEHLEEGGTQAAKALQLFVESLPDFAGAAAAVGPAPAPIEGLKAHVLVARPEARYGVPDADQYLINDRYIVGYSYEHRQPRWTLELLDREPGEPAVEEYGRLDNFREDPRVPDGYRALVDDYRRSGFDRGHLASPANWKQRKIWNSQTFLMSNISPQAPRLNRTGWRLLEEAVRELVLFEDVARVYVLSGPIFPPEPELLGESQIPIPKAFFKSVLAESARANSSRSQLQMWSFVLPNSNADDEPAIYRVPASEVERLTELKLWDALGGSFGDALRATILDMWALPERETIKLD